MTKQNSFGASRPRTTVLLLGIPGILVCLASMGYGFFSLNNHVSAGSDLRDLAAQMRALSQQIVDSARDSELGNEPAFTDLTDQLAGFDQNLAQMQSDGLHGPLSRVDVNWQPVKRAAQTLLDNGPLIVFTQGVARGFEQNIGPMQRDLSLVVDRISQSEASRNAVMAAQQSLWISERIARNIDRLSAGGTQLQPIAQELRGDAGEFIRIVEALTRGDASAGIPKVIDAGALEALSSAFSLFSVVSTSVERIAGSTAELEESVVARDTILTSGVLLRDSVADLGPAIDALAVAGIDNRAFFVAPALLSVVILSMLLIGQRRRTRDNDRGAASINAALQEIAEGDLTVHVPENNLATVDIARQINVAIEHQRQLILNVCNPFERSVQEAGRLDLSCAKQVDIGMELTGTIKKSNDAAVQMVGASEEIKACTADAASKFTRNCEQVAQGYELTQDMSNASAEVRESVQETSKSAKRQSELIQSVTAAAEYIQALNTKISVVAINTRIEAEKAGDYGRPFLGIAEAIADLLREAGEEGRKIISEVRMLQNMSAENLSSMETTVGTVVSILGYIDRLDASLEQINSGSSEISSAIRTADDTAVRSVKGALHMSKLIGQISQHSQEITDSGQTSRESLDSLQQSVQSASQQLARFRTGDGAPQPSADPADPGELARIKAASRIYREEDMTALESAERSAHA